jgi:type IV secretory pathway VirB10-like protein
MTDKQLDEVLEELGREHRALDAPDSLERALYAASESRKSSPEKAHMQFPWVWAAVAVLLAVVAVGGVIWRSRQAPHTQQPQTEQAHSLPVAPRVSPKSLRPSPVPARKSVEPKAEPVRKALKARAPLPPSSPTEAPTVSSLDAFVPLPASEGLPAPAELSIVRIRLRGSDLQQYGLQTPADALAQTMLAEFAVGEDGLPRAIRIVR